MKFQIHGEDRDFLEKSDHIWDGMQENQEKNHEQEKKSLSVFFIPSEVHIPFVA